MTKTGDTERRLIAIFAADVEGYSRLMFSCRQQAGSFEGPTDQALARLRLRRKVRYSVPSFLLMPAILETDDLVASRLLCENTKRLVVLKSPVEVPGFDVIAVWHPRVDEDVAHQWLRSRLARTAKIP